MDRFPRNLGGYCERTIDGITGEPLNTFSNIGFFIAAYLAYRLWRERGGQDGFALALIIVVALIGIGSTAFHAYPTRVTVMMDVMPIQVFILAYLALAQRRYLGLSLPLAILGLALFLGLSFAIVKMTGPRALFGGIGYVPALVALLGFGIVLSASEETRKQEAGRALMLAGGLFAFSLTARTLDRPVCAYWPFGLHMFWHLLNATVLFVVLRAAIRFGPLPRAAPA